MHSINESCNVAFDIERKFLRILHNVKEREIASEELQCERQDDDNRKLEINSTKEGSQIDVEETKY